MHALLLRGKLRSELLSSCDLWLLLTKICLTTIKFKAWMCNIIHMNVMNVWDVSLDHYPKLNGNLAKPSFYFGYGWLILSHKNTWYDHYTCHNLNAGNHVGTKVRGLFH